MSKLSEVKHGNGKGKKNPNLFKNTLFFSKKKLTENIKLYKYKPASNLH